MFSVAYVILPFADAKPPDAIRAALARFQRGGPGDVPDSWLAFDDETPAVRRVHAAQLSFTDRGTNGLEMRGDGNGWWYLDSERIRSEMRRQGIQHWDVRFADLMDVDTFFDRFGDRLERHPLTGSYGQWLNPLGRWDWWDLGGRFDGMIVGDPQRRQGRGVAQISSGENPGRTILANVADALGSALGQGPFVEIDLSSDLNIEMVATLLADARAGREHAYPGALVLPAGAVEDGLRWLDAYPEPKPAETLAWLGLDGDAGWPVVAEAVYARFRDHWAAGVAYHL